MTLEERVDSIGPVDRGDASPLQRILDHVIHISTNTDRISAGIGLDGSRTVRSDSRGTTESTRKP